MTDIVDRLLWNAISEEDRFSRKTCKEAAEEIERLRAERSRELRDECERRDEIIASQKAEIERLRAGQDWQRGEIERLRAESPDFGTQLLEYLRHAEEVAIRLGKLKP